MDQPLDAQAARSRTGGPSFSLANRLTRALWQACWLLLARWTPPVLHAWRALLLRLFGARLGRGCRVHASARIWLPGNLELGDNVLIGPGAVLYNQGRITIGSDSVVSQRAHLCASSHDVDDPHFQLVLRPVTLGRNCWVAAEAFVGPGVTMADGSVLAARGALFADAETGTIYRGNPAVPLRKRAQRAGEA
ncbi:putative colanic acid biosynthesis acetyltransferase [Qipengyuania sp. 6B39]|uniref:putative colanic acid biosynthesis acetyltransferase n=1 Tax=Qipengyuania proteolytica TaxID=2867239 RepID=UPI001C897F57|nr:putative colanic acid biosynthesis acetyltransferase [Qipengyuania proteolytica]MBX7497110.1 putative colanic acid biosynthesis acetyltransferase [Qipengyuania proteolytica]